MTNAKMRAATPESSHPVGQCGLIVRSSSVVGGDIYRGNVPQEALKRLEELLVGKLGFDDARYDITLWFHGLLYYKSERDISIVRHHLPNELVVALSNRTRRFCVHIGVQVHERESNCSIEPEVLEKCLAVLL
jgi:hypothetical protein